MDRDLVCSEHDKQIFAVAFATRFVSFGSSRLAKGKKGGRHFTATLLAVRLGMFLALLRRYDRGGLKCPFLDARISGMTAVLVKTNREHCGEYSRVSYDTKYQVPLREVPRGVAQERNNIRTYEILHTCLEVVAVSTADQSLMGRVRYCRNPGD